MRNVQAGIYVPLQVGLLFPLPESTLQTAPPQVAHYYRMRKAPSPTKQETRKKRTRNFTLVRRLASHAICKGIPFLSGTSSLKDLVVPARKCGVFGGGGAAKLPLGDARVSNPSSLHN